MNSRAIVNKILTEMEALGATLQEKFGSTNISASREEMEAQLTEFLGMAKPDEVKDIQELHIEAAGISDKAYEILEVSEDDWLVVDAQPKEADQAESTKKATEAVLATKPTLGEQNAC